VKLHRHHHHKRHQTIVVAVLFLVIPVVHLVLEVINLLGVVDLEVLIVHHGVVDLEVVISLHGALVLEVVINLLGVVDLEAVTEVLGVVNTKGGHMFWTILGLVAVLFFLGGLGIYAATNWSRIIALFPSSQKDSIIQLTPEQVREARRDPEGFTPPEEKTLIQRLEEVTTQNHLVIGLEILSVIGTAKIDELTLPNNSSRWIPTNNHRLTAVMLEDQSVIVRLPTRHQGSTQWFRFKLQTIEDRDMLVFFGDEPGYAKQFSLSTSSNPVIEFDELFDIRFRITDVPEYKFIATGKGFLLGSGRFRGVFCRNSDSSTWLLYIDNVEEEGSAGFCTNGTYLGETVNPAVLIDNII
jgi:hypothetical protein